MGNKEKTTLDEADCLLWNISVQDDEESYRRLFEYFYPPLCLFAKRYINELAIREDIVQDVFFVVWENRKNIPPVVSAKNYLVTCVKNQCLNYLRKQDNATHYQLRTLSLPGYGYNSEDLYTLAELQELLNQALAKLPENYRKVFEMNRMDNKSYNEIAQEMGVSTRTVERYRDKALEILKKELKDYLPFLIFLLN